MITEKVIANEISNLFPSQIAINNSEKVTSLPISELLPGLIEQNFDFHSLSNYTVFK